MKIFVISLKQSCRRRFSVEAQFRALGLEFDFFDAFSGDMEFDEQFRRYDEDSYVMATGRSAQPGEICSFASHRALWRHCADSGEPIMVLEDDVELDPEFEAAYELAAGLIDTYGFIRLEDETGARKTEVLRRGPFTLWLYSTIPSTSMCYALSPAVAVALVRESEELCSPVGHFLSQCWVHRQPLFGLDPYTVRDSLISLKSDIGVRPGATGNIGIVLRRNIARLLAAARAYRFHKFQQREIIRSAQREKRQH